MAFHDSTCKKCIQIDWEERMSKTSIPVDHFMKHIASLQKEFIRVEDNLKICMKNIKWFVKSDCHLQTKFGEAEKAFIALIRAKSTVCSEFVETYDFHLPMTVYNHDDFIVVNSGLRIMQYIADSVCKAEDFLVAFNRAKLNVFYQNRECDVAIWELLSDDGFCVKLVKPKPQDE